MFGVASSAQQLATAPDPSAGIQYVAVICGGGVPCSNINSGLSWGAAKATLRGALASLPSVKDPNSSTRSRHGTIYMAAGIYPLASTLVLPTSGHNDAIDIIGICGGGNISSGETEPPAATVIEFTGRGPAISQVVPSGGNQNDRAGMIDCVQIDGNQNSNSNSGGIQFGGTEQEYIGPGVRISNFTEPGDFGVQVLNNTGINTNDWREYALLWNDTVGVDAKGPNCSTGSPSSSNAQHHWIDSVVVLLANQVAVHAHCGVAFGRGTIHLSGAINATSAEIIKTDTMSDLGPDFILDEVENNSGGSITRYTAGSGQSITLNGSWDNGEAASTIFGETSGSVSLCGFGGPKGYGLFCNSANAITSTGAGGTMASSGPNGISAGKCSTGSLGSCSHTFNRPYSATPVCTTTGTRFSVTSTGVVIYGATFRVVTWICYPLAN